MTNTRTGRRPTSSLLSRLLLRSGAVMVTALSSLAANAADTTITSAGVATAVGQETDSVTQTQTGTVGALINAADILNTVVVSPGTGNQTVRSNTLASSATGNIGARTVGLANIETASNTDPAEGAATLLSQINGNPSVVTAVVSGSEITVSSTGFDSGVLTNDSNSITAAATLNQGTSTISGDINVAGIASTEIGATAIDSVPAADRLDAEGTLLASTNQLNNDSGPQSGSTAEVLNNTVTLTATSNGDANVVTASPTVDSNTVAATYKGNTTANAITVDNGGLNTLTASAVVSNLQSNVNASADAATDIAAENTGTDVSLTINSTDASTGEDNTLTGIASVSGNKISASATGNEALATGSSGNRITLADGIDFTGVASTTDTSSASNTATGATVVSGASLVVASVQSNVGTNTNPATLRALTNDGDVTATVESLVAGGVVVDGNAVTARATGNTASGAIDASGTRSTFAASLALSNTQLNDYAPVSASNTASNITAQVAVPDTDALATLTTGDVQVTDSEQSATALGSVSTQSASVQATSLDVSRSDSTSLTAGRFTDFNAGTTDVGAAVVSAQTALNSGVTAGVTGASVLLDADAATAAVSGSTLTAGGNTQSAVGFGASASNSLTLDAGTLSGSAGIVNGQFADASSNTAASVATSSIALTVGNANSAVQNSELRVTDNLQRAIAYGADAVNTLTITATTANVIEPLAYSGTSNATTVTWTADGAGYDLDAAAQPTVTANYGLLNDQSSGSDTTSVAGRTDDAVFDLNVGGALSSSKAFNDGNDLVAASYGNQAANAMRLDVATLSVADIAPIPGDANTTGYASVAAVSNVQSLADAANVTAETDAGAGASTTVATRVAGTATGAEITASSNTVQTLAYGNRVTANSLTVDANTLSSTDVTGSVLGSTATTETARAAFAVSNVQYGGTGSITADQDYAAQTVSVGVTGDVSGSDIIANANALTASAYANTANNSASLSATALTTTAGVLNSQTSESFVSATIGAVRTAGNAAINYNFSGSVTAGGVTNPALGSWLYTGNITYTSTDSVLMTALGFTNVGGNDWSRAVVDFPTNYDPTLGGILFAGTVPATAGTPNRGGVLVTVGEDLTNSRLEVTNSVANATAVSNTAANAMTVATTTLTANGVAAPESSVTEAGVLSSAADFNVSNQQSQEGATTASVYGTYAIDASATLADPVIGGSDLIVEGNRQQALAQGNTATNSLSLSAASATAELSAAVNANQVGTAAVAATSDVELFAPAAVSDSTVSISNNRSVAQGNVNDTTSTLTVAATSLAEGALRNGTSTWDNDGTGDELSAEGELVVNSAQSSTAATLSATAVLRGYNEDFGDTTSAGLVDSTLAMDSNVAQALAVVNQATNRANVSGTDLGATLVVGNSQQAATATTASATTTLGATIDGDTLTAVDGSTLRADGNATTAIGTINSATNAASVSGTTVSAGVAANEYASADLDGTAAGAATNAVAAGAVVVNSAQASTAATLGSTATATIGATLTAGTAGGADAIDGSAVSLSNNATRADASVNVASNTATVSGTTLGAPAVVANTQSSSTNATATALGTVTLTATSGPANGYAATGSSVALNGNSTTAMARGNVASNVLNYEAGASYSVSGTAGTSVISGTGVDTSQAAALVASRQANNGSVSAVASNTAYTVALNTGAGGGLVNGSSVSVSNNTVAASAYGNAVSNQINLVALNTGTPTAAVANWQSNTGAISATASGVQAGINGGNVTGFAGSTLRTVGNAVTATAVGNSAVSMIGSR